MNPTPRTRGSRATSTAIVACLAASCGSVPIRVAGPEGTVATTITAAEFPGLANASLGFDERNADPLWASSDEVVFGLRLRKGDEVHRWVLRLSVMFGEGLVTRMRTMEGGAGDIGMWREGSWAYTVSRAGERKELLATSLMLPVTATVSDPNGRKLSSSIIQLPVHLLGRGILPAIDCAIAEARSGALLSPSEPFREESVRPMVDATIAMMCLLNVVQEDDALADYFWQVVEKPSIWSVITGMGVHATLSVPFEKSVVAANLPPGLPTAERAYVAPVQIDVNGSPALFVDIVTIDAVRPYSLCGGMVAATARHPTKPEITLELQLLSARCGKP